MISKGLAYSTLSLLSTVVFLLFAIHMNSWKLDKKLGEHLHSGAGVLAGKVSIIAFDLLTGIVLMFWYLFFITLASLYELNVFGYINPPECASIY